jgi:hypothetical protein
MFDDRKIGYHRNEGFRVVFFYPTYRFYQRLHPSAVVDERYSDVVFLLIPRGDTFDVEKMSFPEAP